MQKIYGNKFQQFSFKSIMISKIIILILIFLTSIFDKWCCSLIISSAASSHDNAWAKRKFGLLLPLIYIKYMVIVFKHKLYLCKGKKICQKARLAGCALFTFSMQALFDIFRCMSAFESMTSCINEARKMRSQSI